MHSCIIRGWRLTKNSLSFRSAWWLSLKVGEVGSEGPQTATESGSSGLSYLTEVPIPHTDPHTQNHNRLLKAGAGENLVKFLPPQHEGLSLHSQYPRKKPGVEHVLEFDPQGPRGREPTPASCPPPRAALLCAHTHKI